MRHRYFAESLFSTLIFIDPLFFHRISFPFCFPFLEEDLLFEAYSRSIEVSSFENANFFLSFVYRYCNQLFLLSRRCFSFSIFLHSLFLLLSNAIVSFSSDIDKISNESLFHENKRKVRGRGSEFEMCLNVILPKLKTFEDWKRRKRKIKNKR